MTDSLRELAILFLRLGATAFGGPAAHIALMEREFVHNRRWLSQHEFLDLMSVVNLIPGPNSTELAIHIGQSRAGKMGGVVAGVCFILPAAFMVFGFAVLYQRIGTLPEIRWVLSGLQPVVVAIVANALWRLSHTAIRNTFCFSLALVVAVAAIWGISEVVLIFAAAGIGLVRCVSRQQLRQLKMPKVRPSPSDNHDHSTPLPALLATGVILTPPLFQIFWIFAKTGALLYGSGYVLLAFMRADLVENLHWISDRQLLDAIALGQITPGPLSTSAAFIGYLLHGTSGALVATIGIFLPAFVFSGISFAFFSRWKNSPIARSFLDAVNASSLALMFVVTYQLARTALSDAGTALASSLFVLTFFLLVRTSCNSLWMLLGGAFCGWLVHHL